MITSIENKKAKFEYEFLETFTAGIELLGPEVKSFCLNGIDLSGSFIGVHEGHLMILNSELQPLVKKNYANFDIRRPRKLLLTKKEIGIIKEELKVKGISCVPIRIFKNEKGTIKCFLAIVRGKKLYEKRQVILERDIKKQLEKELK